MESVDSRQFPSSSISGPHRRGGDDDGGGDEDDGDYDEDE